MGSFQGHRYRLAAWWNCWTGDDWSARRGRRSRRRAVRQRRPADRAVEAELCTVVIQHGAQVIAPGLNQRLDRLEHLDRSRGAGQSGATANIEQVEPERLKRLGHLGRG